MSTQIDIDTIDVAVEDLLRVEVTYGRLQLVLKAVLDKLRSQNEAMNNLKEDQDDMRKNHNKLKRKVDGLNSNSAGGDPASSSTYDPDDIEQLQDQLAKLKDEVRNLQNRVSTLEHQTKADGQLEKLKDEMRNLQKRLDKAEQNKSGMGNDGVDGAEGARGANGKSNQVELDDSILDDIIADHHRRLRNLEEEQKANITNMFLQLGLKPPADQASDSECALRKAELARNLPGALCSLALADPVALKPGKGAAKGKFLLNVPATDGTLHLTPQCSGLAFNPPKVHVLPDQTASEEFTVEAVGDYRGPVTPFITVAISADEGCATNIEAAPFVVTGVTVEPSAAVKPSSLRSSKGPVLSAVDLESPVAVQAAHPSTPAKFILDSPANGGAIHLRPQCPGLTFKPPQVTVPPGKTTSNEFTVEAGKDYQGSPAPVVTVAVSADAGCTTPIEHTPFSVTGVLVHSAPQSPSKSNSRPGTLSHIDLEAPIALRPGNGSANGKFVVDSPANGGSFRLKPKSPGLVFSPSEVKVPAGKKVSEPFTVKAAEGYHGPTAPVVTVDVSTAPGCSTAVEDAPFGVTGVMVEPPPRGGTAGGRPVRRVTLPGTVSVGAQSEPLYFKLDNTVEGAPLLLNPKAQHCTFTPAQVVVPPGSSASGSFVVIPDSKAPAGALPIKVEVVPSVGNTNDVPEDEVTVSGLSIDPAGSSARATREKEEKAARARPNSIQRVSMASAVVDAGGSASDLTCFTVDSPVVGSALQLIPTAPGITFVPPSVEIPIGHTTSQPLVLKATELAKRGPTVIQCTVKPAEGNRNTLTRESYPVVGLSVQEGAIFGAGYDAIADNKPGSPDGEAQRLLRSGLSERMRRLMDDHERRLKTLETTLKAALAALQRPTTAPITPATPYAPTATDPSLAARIKALEAALDKLTKDDLAGLRNMLMILRNELDALRASTPSGPVTRGHDPDALRALEKKMNDIAARLAKDISDLAAKLKDLDGIDGRLNQLHINIQQLFGKVNNMEAAGGGDGSDGDGGGDAQGLDDVHRALQELRDRLAQLEAEKASQDDVTQLSNRVDELEAALASLASRLDNSGKTPALPSRPNAPNSDTADLRALVATHAAMIDNLFTDKANRDAVVRQGQEIQELKALIDARTRALAKPSAATAAPARSQSIASSKVGETEINNIMSILAELERKVQDLADTKCDKQWAQDELDALRALIEELQSTKADATMVAGKAEREYVENALERLRREVEQAMNTTNSGLIDTLDKSLNILRDMIEGKASQADLLKLKDMLLIEQKKDDAMTGDGLAGYKNYRCLSCNRKMDGMRPRPMGMNFNNFVSHLPNVRLAQGKFPSAPLLPAAKAITAGADSEYPTLPPITDHSRATSPPGITGSPTAV